MLKTGVQFDLITYLQMFYMIETPKRGGLRFCGETRYGKANDTYPPDDNPNAAEDYIVYWGVNKFMDVQWFSHYIIRT